MTTESDKSIDTIIATRNLFIQLLDGLSIDALNKVPEGFNNNITWNFGHVVVTQQILCYKLSGLTLALDDSLVSKYAKGTKPETFVDENELNFLKQMAVELIETWVKDMENNRFGDFKTYTTSFNVELNHIDDVTRYLAMHEGLHLGYAMALKRVVGS